MGLDANSLANAVGASVRNAQFVPSAGVLQRAIGIVATYNPAITSVVNEVPVLVLSAEDAGDKFGFGYMAHRLAMSVFKSARGIPTYVIPQAEVAGAKSVGSKTYTVSTLVGGTYHLYIAGDYVPVNLPTLTGGSATTAANVASAVVAAVNAAPASLPVTAAVDGTDTAKVNFTAKTTGTFGDEISLVENLGGDQSLPGGLSVVTVGMTGGSGVPSMANALNNGLGTGDNANELGITDLVHGYLLDTTTMSDISTYVGEGNGFVGLYAKTNGRPFRALTGDNNAGSSALSSLISLADGRLNDRANGVIAVPGSQSHPSEIAAQAVGHMARINNNRAEESYTDTILEGVWPGVSSDRWTSEFDNRDIAVKSGISPTLVKSGSVVMQNVVSFYRPASVPVDSNGYRSMRNISITQNVLNATRVNFEQEKWKGISIVSDVNLVGNAASKAKARDVDSVIDDLVALVLSMQDRAWIFDADYTINALKGNVTIRAGGTGFDSTVKLIYSGEGGILDTVVEFDTSLAASLS